MNLWEIYLNLNPFTPIFKTNSATSNQNRPTKFYEERMNNAALTNFREHNSSNVDTMQNIRVNKVCLSMSLPESNAECNEISSHQNNFIYLFVFKNYVCKILFPIKQK